MTRSTNASKSKNGWLRSLVRFLMRLVFRVEIEGGEHVPQEGGVIIATNHLSRLDIPLLLLTPGRPEITALVADKYMNYPLIRFFVIAAGGIWLDRSRADFSAFRAAVSALKDGYAMGIAPEGTRSHTGGLIEGKPGTVLLAVRSQVPIVPVAVTGTKGAFYRFWERPRIKARFGEPFRLPPLPRENRDAAMQTCTDEVMCRIAVLLPEEYRGVYAHHPRLKELLAEGGPVPSLEKVVGE